MTSQSPRARRLALAAAPLALCVLLARCAVNPVPTPAAPQATASTDAAAAVDSVQYDGAVLATPADAAPTDGAAAADAKPTSAVPVVGFLAVTATDAATDPQFGDHVTASLSNTLGSGRLVVFLAGTGATPKDYEALATEAARVGHRVLALAYPNNPSVASLCGEDSTCYEYVRHEVLDGQNRSPKIAIQSVDSIQHRLVAALQYLAKARPAEGWGSFVQGSALQWSLITVAGHSQGAGHAAFIGRQYSVARVAMFAGVVDATAMGPAAWVNNLHATPAAKYFGFVHTADPVYAKVSANWTALGLGATRTDVGKTPGPWNTAQALVTSAPAVVPHNAVAVDGLTASIANVALVWRHVVGL
ncbi:MAG: hypothetical protein EXR79_07865 [Myxococcales bacterium]|nr:hypothetical protein [Myxococcales bacterium]